MKDNDSANHVGAHDVGAHDAGAHDAGPTAVGGEPRPVGAVPAQSADVSSQPSVWAGTELATPIGRLGVIVTELGVLVVAFGGLAEAEELVRAAAPELVPGALPAQIERVRAELTDYFAGRLKAFTVPIDWRLSSGFARRVREALYGTVPYGDVVSYGALARQVGGDEAGADFTAARAVGRAMATNPVPVIVPCHRVLASDGSLHGFGGGLEMKRRLLAIEGAAPMTLDDVLALG